MVDPAVGGFLTTQGHAVYEVRHILPPATTDPIVVANANELRAVIITWNRKHFRPLIDRNHGARRDAAPHVGLISVQCRMSEAVDLFDRNLRRIVFEFEERQRDPVDQRLIVEMSVAKFTIL